MINFLAETKYVDYKDEAMSLTLDRTGEKR